MTIGPVETVLSLSSRSKETQGQGKPPEKPAQVIHPATPVRKAPGGESGKETDPGPPKCDTSSLLEEIEENGDGVRRKSGSPAGILVIQPIRRGSWIS